MYPYFYPGPLPCWYSYNMPPVNGIYEEPDDEFADNYRMMRGEKGPEEEYTVPPAEQPSMGMKDYEDKSKMVTKDSFVPGFVPNHNHASLDYTSVEMGHVHQCLDITYPPTPSEGGTHVHYTEGYVLFENGHNHHYKSCSGPAIPVGNGMHVHYYDFYTSEDMGHRHHVSGVDNPAPGNM